MIPAQNNIDKGWWWDRTWSPLAMRCEKTSPGCTNCWHLRFADRMKMNPKFPAEHREAYAGDREPIMTGRLNNPMKWRKPQVVAVQLMGDLFHESVPFLHIEKIYAHMALCPQHTFVVLTKRVDRMAEFVCAEERRENVSSIAERLVLDNVSDNTLKWKEFQHQTHFHSGTGEYLGEERWIDDAWVKWPLPNVIAMTTVENQEMADKRIPILLRVPAPVLGISVEPMLSDLKIAWALKPFYSLPSCMSGDGPVMRDAYIKWMVCGCETGPKARGMETEWANHLKEQCRSANVPFFFKKRILDDGSVTRLLDGQTWDEFPEMPNGV